MEDRTARRLNDILLVSGLAGLLLLAGLMDALRRMLFAAAQSLADQQRLLFLLPLMQLLLMLAALGLIWVAVSGAGYSRWVTAVYLVIGLALLYGLGLLSALPFPDWLYGVTEYLSPDGYLFQVGGVSAALGLISLFFWKEDRPPASEPEI
jgi:hypothetical protein